VKTSNSLLKSHATRPEHSKREGLRLGWPKEVKQWAELHEESATTVHLFAKSKQRGWLNPGRLLVETFYPLGLLRAWTWLDLDANAIIYPEPVFHHQTFSDTGDDEEGELTQRSGSDDFHDMRNYQPGDSPRHILWRSYARQDSLLVKQFSTYSGLASGRWRYRTTLKSLNRNGIECI